MWRKSLVMAGGVGASCLAVIAACQTVSSGEAPTTGVAAQAVTVKKGAEVALDAPVFLPVRAVESDPQVAFGAGFFSVLWDSRASDSAQGAGKYYPRIARVPTNGVQVFPSAPPVTSGWAAGLVYDGQNLIALALGSSAVSAVRVDANLLPLDSPGLAVAGATTARHIATDGNGKSLATWVSGTSIEAALISSAGVVTPLGPVGTIPNYYKNSPDVAWGGGTWLVVWGVSTAVRAQRLSATGTLAGAPFDVITPANTSNLVPCVASNGTGFLVGAAARGADSKHRILVRLVGADGSMTSAAFEPIHTPTGINTYDATAAWDGQQYVIVWQDERSYAASKSDLYANWISSTGSVLAPTDLLVSNDADDEGQNVEVACDTTSRVCAAVWRLAKKVGTTTETHAMLSRLSRTSGLLDSQPLTVSRIANFQLVPALSEPASSSSLVVWEDTRLGNNPYRDRDIHARWVDTTTGQPAGANSFPVTQATGDQTEPATAAMAGKALIAWRDQRDLAAGPQIYYALASAGQAPSPVGGQRLVATADEKSRPQVGANGKDFLVVWGIVPVVQGARVDASGTVLDPQPITIATQMGTWAPAINEVAGTSDGFVVVWRDTGSFPQRFRAMRLGSDAQPLWSGPVLVSAPQATGVYSASAAGSPSGQVLAVWSGASGGTDVIRATLVDATGNVVGGFDKDLPVPAGCKPAHAQYDARPISVTWDGARWVVAYSVMDTTTLQRDVVVVRVGADGALQDAEPLVVGEPGIDEHDATIKALERGRYQLAYERFVMDSPEAARRVRARQLELGVERGGACTVHADCRDAQCVEGVCCDAPCAGSCESCLGSRNTAGVDGTCSAAKAGMMPREGTQCMNTGDPCGPNGTCNGQGSCTTHAATGTPCGAPECNANVARSWTCNPSGQCVSADQTCSNGLACLQGACPAGCVTRDECLAGRYCASGVCLPEKVQGEVCAKDEECSTRHCVDSYCCDSACDGACQSCSAQNNVTGKNGTCSPTKADIDPRDRCEAQGECKADGECDGAGACREFAPAGTSCGAASCTGSTPVGGLCDGKGSCEEVSQPSCVPYGCQNGKCRSTCSASSDCSEGATCNVARSECVRQSGACADDWSVEQADGSRAECGGYRCLAGGCQQQCNAVTDCNAAAGYRCEGNACVRSQGSADGGATGATTLSDEKGCGCRTAGKSSGPGGLLAILAVASLASLRRRDSRGRMRSALGSLLALVGIPVAAFGCRSGAPEDSPTGTTAAPLSAGLEKPVSADSPLVPTGSTGTPSAAWGGNNHLVVWHESGRVMRTGTPVVFGARVSASGQVVDPAGIRISTSNASASQPAVAFGAGVFLVAWDGINGALLDANGNVVVADFPICAAAGYQGHPSVAFDGTNFLVVWVDNRTSPQSLYGTRVTPAGKVLDGTGVLIATDTDQDGASVVFDSGRYLVAYRGSQTVPYSATGAFVNTVTPAMAIGQPKLVSAVEYRPAIACGGGKCLLVGEFLAGYNLFDVRGSLLQSSDLAWVSDLDLTTTTRNNGRVGVVYSSGQFVVAWHDDRNGTKVDRVRADVYAARVNPSTGAVTDANGKAVSVGPGENLSYETKVSLSTDGTTALISWADLRHGGWDSGSMPNVYASRWSSAGAVLDSTGIMVAASGPKASIPVVDKHGSGFLTAWTEFAGGSVAGGRRYDVVLALLDSAGGVTGTPRKLAANAGLGSSRSVQVASLGTGAMGAWQLTDGIRTTFTGATEAPLPGLASRLESSLAGSHLAAAAAGQGTYLLVTATTGSPSVLRITRYDAGGAILDAAPVVVGSAAARPMVQDIVASFDGSHFLVVWRDTRSTTTGADIWASRVPLTGAPGAEFPVCQAIGAQGRVALDCSPSTTTCGVAWSDEREGSLDVRMATLRDGALEQADAIVIARGALGTDYNTPSIAIAAEQDRYLVAWQRVGYGLPVILQGAWVEANGKVTNVPPATVVADVDSPENPILESAGGGSFLLGYVRYAGLPGNHRKYHVRTVSGQFLGAPCSTAAECGSGLCVEGVCCDSLCGNADPSDCLTCTATNSVGTCSTDLSKPECVPPAEPTPQPNGEPCGTNAGCISQFCVEGVCCNEACSEGCRSCQKARTGGLTGTCASIQQDLAPKVDGACPLSADVCDADGLCDGTGQCRAHAPQGTSCGVPACQVNGDVGVPQCDGAGTCVPVLQDCGAAVCALGKCAVPCLGTQDCAPGYVCVAGGCVGKRSDGDPCDSSDQCNSGHCVDGVCCNTSCSGPCVSCTSANNTTGSTGTCGSTRPGLNPRGGCVASGIECGGDGTCDGAGSCSLFAKKGAECGKNGCDNNSVMESRCDGAGVCESSVLHDCGEFRCDSAEGTCLTRCNSNADCVAGSVCEQASGACVFAGNTCTPDGFGIVTPDGEQFSCNGYRCVGGRCQQQCNSTEGCAPGYDCAGGACAANGATASTTATSESSCGCRVAGASTRPAGLWIAASLAALCAVRRRRRGPREPSHTRTSAQL